MKSSITVFGEDFVTVHLENPSDGIVCAAAYAVFVGSWHVSYSDTRPASQNRARFFIA